MLSGLACSMDEWTDLTPKACEAAERRIPSLRVRMLSG
jgi:hypothetical protein